MNISVNDIKNRWNKIFSSQFPKAEHANKQNKLKEIEFLLIQITGTTYMYFQT